MAYGMQVFDDSATLIWDSSTTGSGVIVDMIDIAYNQSLTKTYPAFPGRTLRVLGYSNPSSPTSNGNMINFLIDYDLGYPRVNFLTLTNSTSSRRFIVVVI